MHFASGWTSAEEEDKNLESLSAVWINLTGFSVAFYTKLSVINTEEQVYLKFIRWKINLALMFLKKNM